MRVFNNVYCILLSHMKTAGVLTVIMLELASLDVILMDYSEG